MLCKLNIRFPVVRKEICGFKFRLRFFITLLPLLCMKKKAGWVKRMRELRLYMSATKNNKTANDFSDHVDLKDAL